MMQPIFSPGEIEAMVALIAAFEERGPSLEAIDELLQRLLALIDADHAEVSTWRIDEREQSHMTGRVVHDPRRLMPPPCILPAGEQPESRGKDTEVRTWTTDATPGWGGPALLSVRECSSETLLLALRRTPGRHPFAAREAALVDALHRCDRLWRVFNGITDDSESPPLARSTPYDVANGFFTRLAMQFA